MPLESFPHCSSKLFDSRQIREVALISLVVDLVAIGEDLKHAAASGCDFDSDVPAALCEDFVGHPGHYAMMTSGYAVNDLYFYFAYSGQGLPPVALGVKLMR